MKYNEYSVRTLTFYTNYSVLNYCKFIYTPILTGDATTQTHSQIKLPHFVR